MFLNLAKTFINKGIYGLLANISYALTEGSKIEPQGDEVESFIWKSLGVASFTGLAGVANRLRGWDSSKA